MSLPAHPDTIPDLAPDCRRVLRDDYMAIQAAMQWLPPGCLLSTLDVFQRATVMTERRERVVAKIKEYRRTAALWGIEVPS